MKIDRTKNAGKNIVLEVLKNMFNIIMPFVLRTAMIRYLGMEYTGLGGLFTSILNVLNLAELGVGSAMVFSMYKPIAEDDTEKICALVNLYKIYYRVIGSIILLMGIVLLPNLKHLVNGSYPEGVDIHILFLLNLSATVLSYWLFAYKTSLLAAHQQEYISIKIDIFFNVVCAILQLLSLIIFSNYYVYLCINLLRQIISNIVKYRVVNKTFPKYKAKGRLNKEEEIVIRNRVKDLFTCKLGGTITTSADSIVISSFLGLTILAQYQNYYYIYTSILAIVGTIYNATRAGIGNSIVCESKEKNLNDLKIFSFFMCWIICVCATCFLTLYQPFMQLWVGKENLLPYGVVICIVLMFGTRILIYLFTTYKDAAGIWHQDRFRPLIAGVANLIMNLIMVQIWGLYGVIISTVISESIIEIPWLIHNLFNVLFKISEKKYVLFLLKYLLIEVCVVIISVFLINLIQNNGIGVFAIKLVISFILPNLILLTLFIKTDEFKSCLTLVKKMIRRG